MIDYSIKDVLGFELPKRFVAEVEIEDDESSAEVEYEQIQDEAFAEAMFWAQHNQRDEDLTDDLMFAVSEALQQYVEDTFGEGETTNTVCDTLYEYRSLVEDWAKYVNGVISADAQRGFEDRQSGDYWAD